MSRNIIGIFCYQEMWNNAPIDSNMIEYPRDYIIIHVLGTTLRSARGLFDSF